LSGSGRPSAWPQLLKPGQPRPWDGTGRKSWRALPARELNDPDKHRTCQYGAARQAGQQPEPAVTQRHGQSNDGHDGEGGLHEPSQHPARHGGRRDSSHGSSVGTRISGVGGDGNRHRSGEHKPARIRRITSPGCR
jgi:hypothetical protein